MGDVRSDNVDWSSWEHIPGEAAAPAVPYGDGLFGEGPFGGGPLNPDDLGPTQKDSDDRVTVSLSEQEKVALIDLYVSYNMGRLSLAVFDEALKAGKTLEQATYEAVLNDVCNDVLAEHIADKNAGNFFVEFGSPPETKRSSKMIWVTFQKEGIHRYPAAATDPKLKTGGWDDVSFLGAEHRHIFHFRVDVEVVHSDRDIEFIQFKRWLERLYSQGTLELNHKSCEMIAEDLAVEIQREYPGRELIIEVSEDGENGAKLHFPR